ncbi:MAG: hypothetical protein Q8O86_02915 [Dehalococcoidia bacterium]|nr:hypothetical protein [Dehalococcoidia bacterium]
MFHRAAIAEIASLEQMYVFRRPEEVIEFLEDHPFLVALLFDAHPQIVKHFGPRPDAVLEVVVDPEAMADRELFALIRTHLPPRDALSRLERLDEEWWIEALERAQGALCIDLEFA